VAIAIAVLNKRVPGSRKFEIVEITLENPYVAGGYSLQALQASLGLTQVDQVVPFSTSSPLYDAYWDQVNKKIQVAVSSTGAEAGAIDLSAVKVYALVIGY
jgi:hypothetical protein